jgi:hypothetical protein
VAQRLEDRSGPFSIVDVSDEDAVGEPPARPTTTAGDLWLLGRHRLPCGDSTLLDDLQRLMWRGQLGSGLHRSSIQRRLLRPRRSQLARSDSEDNMCDREFDDFISRTFFCCYSVCSSVLLIQISRLMNFFGSDSRPRRFQRSGCKTAKKTVMIPASGKNTSSWRSRKVLESLALRASTAST